MSADFWGLREAYLLHLNALSSLAKSKAKQKIDHSIQQIFQELNHEMLEKIGQSYPEFAVLELAQITSDCLALEPQCRPNAKEILEHLQNLFWLN
jgi:hypothetical protein